jgi:hypothetical protein
MPCAAGVDAMRDAAGDLRREVYTFLHHLVLLVVALAVAFLWWAWPSGDHAYNLLSSWKIEGPLLRAVALVFIVLCVLRLAAIHLAGRMVRESSGRSETGGRDFAGRS